MAGPLDDMVLQLESEPGFRRLGYRDQVRARADILGPIALSLPEVQALPPEGQASFLDYVAFRPPAMETPYGLEAVGGIAKRLEKRPPQENIIDAIQSRGGLIPALRYEIETLPATVERTYALYKGAGMASGVGAAVRWLQYALPRVAEGIVKAVAPGSEVAQTVERVNRQSEAWRRDELKYDEYARFLLSTQETPEGRDFAKAMSGVSTLVNMGELAALGAGVASGFNLATWGAGMVSKTAKGWATVGKLATQAGGEGSLQFARDYLKDKSTDPEVNRTLSELVRKFGPDVAVNTLAIGAFHYGGELVKSARMMFHKVPDVAMTRGVKGATFEEKALLLDEVTSFKHVDPATYATAPPEVQRVIRHTQAAKAVADLAIPPDEVIYAAQAGAHGWDLTPSGGGWKATKGGMVRVFPKGGKEAIEGWIAKLNATHLASMGDDAEKAARVVASRDAKVTYDSSWVGSLVKKKYGTPLMRTPEGKWQITTIGDDGFPQAITFDNLTQAGDHALSGSLQDNLIDASLAPDGGVIVDGQAALKYTDTILTGGDRQQIYQHFKAYAEHPTYKPPVFLKTADDVRLYNEANHFYIVDEYNNYSRSFTDANQAMAWMKAPQDSILKLEDMAMDKGYKLGSANGGWYLYTEGGQALGFRSLAEAKDALKSVPIPEIAPTVTGIPADVDRALSPPVKLTEYSFDKAWEAKQAHKPHQPAVGWQVRKLTQPVQSSIEKGLLEAGAPPTLARDTRDLYVAKNMLEVQNAHMGRVRDEMFTLPGKQRLTSEQTREIAIVLEQPTREGAIATLEKTLQGGQRFSIPKDDILAHYDLYHKMMGEATGKGIAGFGEIGRRMEEGAFISGYVPHAGEVAKVRHWLNTHPNISVSQDMLPQILEDSGINASSLPFYRNMRVADFIDWATSKTPLEATDAVLRYINKEKLLNPVVDRLRRNLITASEGKPLASPVYGYLADIVDMVDGKLVNWEAKDVSKALHSSISAFSAKIAGPLRVAGLTPKQVSNLADLYQSLMYSSVLGFRPYPIVRNMFTQPLMMGAKLGNGYLMGAWKRMGNMSRGEIDALRVKLRDNGILLPEGMSNIGSGGLPTAPGMRGFRSSDDYTRLTGWLMTKTPFDEAKALVEAGKILDEKVFLKRSGVWTVAEDVQRQVIDLVRGGNWEAAHMAFARGFNYETLFPYARAFNPRLLQGRSFVGRLFGHLGSFPLWWVDGIRSHLSRATLGEKLAFSGRLAVNFGAAYAGVEALGIRGEKDWTPWGPAGFPSGGPYFDTMVDFLRSTRPGQVGQEARGKALGTSERGGNIEWRLEKFISSEAGRYLVPIPGRLAFEQFVKGIKRVNEGDPLSGVWLMMGAPVNPRYGK